MPDRSFVQNDTSGSDKLMHSATQNLKLSTSVGKISGLVKPVAVARKNLVGTQNQGISMAFCHLTRLSFCKRKRAVGSTLPIGLEDSLDRLFVHCCRLDVKPKPGSGKQVPTDRARRSENQGLTHQWPWRRANSFIIAVAVFFIERCVTSIIGQCLSTKMRRASRTLLRTASMSV